jgi:hypothetical protein
VPKRFREGGGLRLTDPPKRSGLTDHPEDEAEPTCPGERLNYGEKVRIIKEFTIQWM